MLFRHFRVRSDFCWPSVALKSPALPVLKRDRRWERHWVRRFHCGTMPQPARIPLCKSLRFGDRAISLSWRPVGSSRRRAFVSCSRLNGSPAIQQWATNCRFRAISGAPLRHSKRF